jgi:hypothetical protein
LIYKQKVVILHLAILQTKNYSDMETLIVNKAKIEDLTLLITIAKKMGMDIALAPKESVNAKPDVKKFNEIADKIKRNAADRLLQLHNIEL